MQGCHRSGILPHGTRSRRNTISNTCTSTLVYLRKTFGSQELRHSGGARRGWGGIADRKIFTCTSIAFILINVENEMSAITITRATNARHFVYTETHKQVSFFEFSLHITLIVLDDLLTTWFCSSTTSSSAGFYSTRCLTPFLAISLLLSIARILY